jgi:hypothetical protein
MKQLKISLPDELRAKLDEAAAASGKSVAEEIRSRVEQTFREESQAQWEDDKMRGLYDAIHWLALNIHLNMEAKWHQNQHVMSALLDGVRSYMLEHQRDDVEISADAKDSAYVIGEAFARAYLQLERERRERRGED